MNRSSLIDELDRNIDALLADAGAELPNVDEGISDLSEIARDLCCLPRAEFKAQLRAGLDRQPAEVDADILPTLFGKGYGAYPVHRWNFVASLALHAAAAALVISSGVWVAQHRADIPQEIVSTLIEPSPYVLPVAPDNAGGGGGGGDRDKMPAPKGNLPKQSMQQLAPPAMVIRNQNPKLPVEPSVVAPPNLVLPRSAQLGDTLSSIMAQPSNGTGSGGGIGSGSGGGIGSGSGPGVGPGHGGGFGGGVFRVGGGVSAPRALYDPDPEYSDEARRAKYQGVVIVWAVIGADGRPRDLRIARSLGMGLDEKAIEAVRSWRFEPAKKDGQPVAVQINIEVNFHLY